MVVSPSYSKLQIWRLGLKFPDLKLNKAPDLKLPLFHISSLLIVETSTRIVINTGGTFKAYDLLNE